MTRVERIALDAAKAASKALECTMDFNAIARLAAALVPYVDSYGSMKVKE